jgi:hypothetical protein
MNSEQHDPEGKDDRSDTLSQDYGVPSFGIRNSGHPESTGKRTKALISLVVILAIIGVCLALLRHGHLPTTVASMLGGNQTPRLFPVCELCKYSDYSYSGGTWGFIDSSGNLAIGFQFEETKGFSEGLAAVKTGGKWGFIDEGGRFVINPQFDEAFYFSQGLAAVKVGKSVGYIDKEGKYQINPQFDQSYRFSEGLAPVKIGEKWGYIDKQGKYQINPQFDDANGFSDGLAAVAVGGKYGYIDKEGKYAINPQFDRSGDFSQGLAKFSIGDKSGYIDKQGKYLINPQFDDAYNFDSNGTAMVKVSDKWGYIGKDGKYAINPQFEDNLPFSEGMAGVKVGGKWGYIDETGKIVINPQFNHAGSFERGIAPIFPFLYINTKGEWVWPSLKTFQTDFAQFSPLLQADLPSASPGGEGLEGRWQQCAIEMAKRPLCYWAQQGDASAYGQSIFRDHKIAELAVKLHYDGIFFESSDGKTLFAMKVAAEGWVPFPGVPPAPFMTSDVPTLPTLTGSSPPEGSTAGLVLQVAATERAWVAVDADGKTVLQQVMNPNEVQNLQAHDSFDVTVGNASGIALTLNGQPLTALGGRGEVRSVHLTLDTLKNPAR